MKPKYNFFANTGYALAGLKQIWLSERSFRIEVVLIAVFTALNAFLRVDLTLQLVAQLAMLGIMLAECINSAIERTVDLVTSDFHPLAGAAKDAGSAAVFISISCAVLAWAAVIARGLEWI